MPRTYNVIDADGHVLEPIDIWDKYIDPKFRDRAPRIVRDTDGKERLDVEGQVLGSQKGFGVIGAIGARQGEVEDEAMQYIDGRKGGFDPHARIPDMDLDGIDAAFLYPSVGLFAGAIKDPPLAAAVCRAYNRWLADYCRAAPARLIGVAMLPLLDVEESVRELEHAVNRLGFRAAFARPNPYGGRPIHHPVYVSPTPCRRSGATGSRTPRCATCFPIRSSRWRRAPGSCWRACSSAIRGSASCSSSRAAAGSPTGWSAWTSISRPGARSCRSCGDGRRSTSAASA